MAKAMDEVEINGLIDEFETMTTNAEDVQKQYLKEFLEQNSTSEYLRKWGLNGKRDVESYKARVPIVAHDDLAPYIQRMVDGDTSHILLGKPVTTFSISSGSSGGRPKLVPFTEESLEFTIRVWRTAYAYRSREFPITGEKALQFIYSSKKVDSKEGVFIGQATTNIFRHPRYKDVMKQIRSTPCSPHEIIFAPDFHQALYCHLLCGLIYREEIQVVSSGFAHSIVNGFQKLEQVWEELVNDIRDGVLSERITEPSIRAAVSKILRPDPASADLIYAKCKGLEKWRGVIPTLFPNVKYVLGIMTGSMEPYVEKLRAYAGHVPLVGGDYAASEGWIGLNANPKAPPESVAYSVVPNVGYFEFLPISDDITDVHDTVGLTEVKLGEEYEVIISNHFGVYRYKLGDVVKVVGFHNSTPKLQFVRRSGVILNVNTDKTTERDLQRSVELASKVLSDDDNGCELIEYSSQVDRSTDPGHYVVYWEIAGEPADDVLRECCNALDRGFVDMVYINSRHSRDVGPLELRIVRRGTFANLLEHSMSRGGAAYQFKTPRCVPASNAKVLEILSDGVVKSYFSSAFG